MNMEDNGQNEQEWNCIHCKTAVAISSNFCPVCGNRIISTALTLKEVFLELFEVIFVWNKKFLRTVTSLFLRPNKVISYYLAGGRNTYVSPLFFLLLCYFLYFLVISLSDREMFIISQMKGAVSGYNSGSGDSELRELDVNSLARINRYSKILFFLLVFIFATCSKFIFRVNRRNFAQHLAINAYLLGQAVLLGTVFFNMVVLAPKLDFLPALLIVFYVLYAQYDIFRGKMIHSFLRTLLFTFAGLASSILVYTILAIIIAAVMSQPAPSGP